MFSFTKQEQTVLRLFIAITLLGSVLHYAFKKYPTLHDAVNLIDSDKIYAKININTASVQELVSIPYIGEYTAENIRQYRQNNGPFTSVEQIKNVKGVRDKNYLKFRQHLKLQ